MPHTVSIRATHWVTHNVRRLVVDRPEGLTFEPGQATEVSIDHPDWKDQGRPFTFTGLPDDRALEFTIKTYPDHQGVTDQLAKLDLGDRLNLDEVFGAITYKKPGTFIAGGAGVTPFISIFRMLEKTDQVAGNRLLFSNRTEADIILRDQFVRILGDDAIFTLTQERKPDLEHGRIDKAFIEKYAGDRLDQPVYLCGPPQMVEDLSQTLHDLGAPTDAIVIEE